MKVLLGSQILDNLELINELNKPKYSRVFGENSPKIISMISDEISVNNYTSSQVAEIYGWNIGDKIGITLSTGENIEMQIIGINHDDKSDGSGKAGLTLQMVDCLATKYPMTKSASLTGTNVGGYVKSGIKTTTLPTIKTYLPEEWQEIIKIVDKKSANGGSTNYTETVTSAEELFLLSFVELYGEVTTVGPFEVLVQDAFNEGSQYEYWKGKSVENKIKKFDSDANGEVDTATGWWLRSVPSDKTNSFTKVGDMGYCNWTTSWATQNHIVFAFCI